MALKKESDAGNIIFSVIGFIILLYFFKPHVENIRNYINELIFPVKKVFMVQLPKQKMTYLNLYILKKF